MTTNARRPTVLCVDDEPVVLTSLRDQLLQHFGGRVDVELAQDAVEAIEVVDELVAEGRSLPVVLCDHIMPGMKGDELLIHLHARLPDTRNILLTGQAGVEAVGRAVNEAGLYRFIGKPWDRDDLVLTVREAIASFEAEREVRFREVELARAHQAARRFVPFDFLALVGRSELTDVVRGDASEREISVFLSDIRGFTGMIEARDGPSNVEWINEYLAWMEPPIHDHGGFIENVTGDGIAALFVTADHAVRAGVDALLALAGYNGFRAARGDPPLRIGIGVSTGPVTLGVVGGADRLKCAAVGDTTNLAAGVEALTKRLGPFLITGETRSRLVEPERFRLRFVDRVRVAGRRAATDLYEVLDGLPEEERERRMASRSALTEALAVRRAGDLVGAAARFEALAAADPEDRVFAWHAARCRRLARAGSGDAGSDVTEP